MSVPNTSGRTSRKKRCPVSLDQGFEQRLLAYAAAASAAGVAAISLAQPCQAEIIHTKVRQYINSSYSLDLNNDGIVDFTINNSLSVCTSGEHQSFRQFLWVQGAETNQVWDNYGPSSSAAALGRGSIVGPGKNFEGLGNMDRCRASNGSSYRDLYGSWAGDKHRYSYLGFAFSIDGETHYGWARVSSIVGRECKSTVLLAGYAYESVPGKPIEVGKTVGEDVVEASTTKGTLGSLALGSVQPARPNPELCRGRAAQAPQPHRSPER